MAGRVGSRRAFLRHSSAALLLASASGPLPLFANPDVRSRYQQRVLAMQPVAYWRFDDTGPMARDASGYGHDGTYHGDVAFGQPGVVRGERSVGIGLNGADAFVEVAHSDALSQPGSSRGLTVEAWLRPDVLTFTGQTSQHYVHWLGKGEEDDYEWGFRFYSQDSPRPNRISAYIWNPAGRPGERNEGAGAYVQDPVKPGEWIHVVACYPPGDARDSSAGVSIFKNGEFRAGPGRSRGARYASYDIHPVIGHAPLRLGTRDGDSYLRGGLAEVAIYPRVLQAREIRDHYATALGR